jgi:molybdopterin molybdotransferase
MPAGEWVPAGAPILCAGTRLKPAALGLLATLGLQRVRVRARPRVAILATGDELVAPGAPVPPGGMYESNGALLAAGCAAAGAEPTVLPHVADRLPELIAALRAALEAGPRLVLTSGGVSVGPADLVPEAWRALGAEELFWRVAVKPGKPVFAARHGSTAVIGLSGSPAACWTAFTVLVAPLLRHWAGCPQPFPAAERVRLSAPLAANADAPRLLWTHVGPDGTAEPPARRAAGVLVHMAAANAVILQGAGTAALPAGAWVWVLRTDRIGEPGAAATRAVLTAAARPAAAGAGLRSPEGAAAPPVGVCAIGGWSGHGKTTLIERLVAWFAAAGEPVATLKHHAHGAPAEVAGKDGSRHRAAGAGLSVTAGPGGILWSESADGEPDPERLLRRVHARAAEAGCRWLLVEGYHAVRLPRLEVLDGARAAAPRSAVDDGLFLIAAADPAAVAAPAGVPVVSRDAVAEIAAAIRARCAPEAGPG